MLDEGTRPLAMDAAEGSIVVNAPVADVYERWLVFEDYPKFITAIKRVRKLDENHFSASLSFNGKQHEATLEVMLRVRQRRLAWRTLADQRAPDHLAAGVVSFAPLSDKSTCVTTSSLRRRLKIPLMRNGYRVIANECWKMPNEIHSYSELQQQIHDDLRAQHPEWVEPNGNCPTCESYELRLAELLGVTRDANVAEVRKSSFLGDAGDY